MIGTKLHIAREVTKGEEAIIDRMLAAPKYVISPEVCDMIGREDVRRAVMSVLEARIARLPYDPCLIEFAMTDHENGKSGPRYFVLLSETKTEHTIAAEICWLKEDNEKQEMIVVDKPINVLLQEKGFQIEYDTLEDPAPWAATAGCCFALLMLNTRGIEKRVIETDKINRARARHRDGREPIPRHTIVHIGTIYDRQGKAHAATGTGRHMPVHLRSGFVRRQHFGKGNEEIKTVYIPPCIVNYREESGEKPKIPDKVVAV